MDTNKMRDQFEAAWRARYPEHGEIALKRSGLDPEDYCNTRVKDAWWAWQASREAVVVELPDSIVGARRYQHAEAAFAHKEGIDDCREAIEAQGLKVAP
ncbi:TPA: hypothetical protein QEM72_004390 [Pseudomonas putida]|uniref:hypothetical protein n=1 Tax=Pseudomonas putida TaxID=303 RepID=UPI0023639D36|nr:hypothetical protein [Pseudomonas putida]MDD2077099.1 hypothetical protein [Pseudomonas putida]HDS1693806.1 hypothetical protein [Pseudomonas putida]